MQYKPYIAAVADDTSQTDRRTQEVADVASIQDAFALLPKLHLKYRSKSLNFQLFLSTINVTYRHRWNDQYSHRCDESSSIVCVRR
jgi:hypothetical protein